MLIGTSGLTLAVALTLALSLRRRTSRTFSRAYQRLVQEVNEREAAEQALRGSEQRFRALVHNASDVFTVIADDGVIRYQSPAVEAVLGHPPDSLIGTSLLDVVHADDREAARRLFEQSRRHSRVPVVGEVRMLPRGPGQAPRRFEMTVTDLLADPTVNGLVLNYSDVTERALYQERLTRQAFHIATGVAMRDRPDALLRTRTRPCTRPRPTVAAATPSSTPPCTRAPSAASPSRPSCAGPSTPSSSSSTTSRSSCCAAARWWASRRCCAGTGATAP